MSGSRTGSRRDALVALRDRTYLEIRTARRTENPDLPRLRLLQQRIAEELGEVPATVKPAPKPVRPPTGVQQHLEKLDVTALHVKTWALEQGLIAEVRRGRVSGVLVDAYAEFTRLRGAAVAAHGVGCCTECDEPMIKRPVWTAAEPHQRAVWKSYGLARQGGRGLCTRCYASARSLGVLEQSSSRGDAAGTHVCQRCGLPDIDTDLCVDCERFVMNDRLPHSSYTSSREPTPHS